MLHLLVLIPYHLRKKIAAVISTQQPTLDPDHPEIMEEARYWVTVDTERTTREKTRVELNTNVRVKTDASTTAALTSNLSSHSTVARSATDIAQQLRQLSETAPAPSGAITIFNLFDTFCFVFGVGHVKWNPLKKLVLFCIAARCFGCAAEETSLQKQSQVQGEAFSSTSGAKVLGRQGG